MSGVETVTEEIGWTEANLQRLLAAMKTNIPEEDRMSIYSKGLKAVDWKKVAFPPFSPEACQERWTEMLQKIRKTRSLTELIVIAEGAISKLVQTDKAKYVKTHQLAPAEHNRRMLEFRKKSPQNESRNNRKRKSASADTPDQGEDEDGLPPKPPFNGCNLFFKERLASMAGVSRNSSVSVWAQHCRDFTDRQRNKYSKQCRELKSQYSIKLNEYLTTLTPAEQKACQTRHPSKCQHLGAEQTTNENLYRPSDSEDEDIEDNSSDEEEENLGWEEEEEEEEEEGDDITFEMF